MPLQPSSAVAQAADARIPGRILGSFEDDGRAHVWVREQTDQRATEQGVVRRYLVWRLRVVSLVVRRV